MRRLPTWLAAAAVGAVVLVTPGARLFGSDGSEAVEGPASGGVGPLSLGEHLVWFVVLSLAVFLVYNGLREESVAVAARRGVQRWFAFVVGSAVLAGVFHLLSSNL